MGELTGKVAVVTGASRGIGKGIALVLAEQGATVYVTGRSVTPGEYYLPGTVGETAAECTRRGEAEGGPNGGRGIAVACDHADDEQVAALFARVQAEQGRLDLLVNNAFQLSDDLIVKKPFWEKPLSNLEMWQVGVKSSFVAAWHASQIMVPQKSGLIVAICGYAAVTYTFGVVFGTAKSAVDRMVRDMAIELEPHDVASISLWQGLTFNAKKFAATLQYGNPHNITLLRVDTDAGHGRGKPLAKVIEEMADIYTFLARTLDLNW